MHVNFTHIGRRVKEIRNLKDMSQAELAEQIDMSVPYISLIETGKKKASLTTLLLISNTLGVTIDTLLNGNQTSDSILKYEHTMDHYLAHYKNKHSLVKTRSGAQAPLML